MLRKLLGRLLSKRAISTRDNKPVAIRKICRLETLENRRLLAVDIRWVNEFDPQSNDFIDQYGQNTAVIASQIVNRAIADWEAVITDFNYDGDNDPATVNAQNNTFNLNFFALPIAERGATQNWNFLNGRPISADIQLDDNGDGTGWYFDTTPLDDAEFTGIVNSGMTGAGPAFAASFVDTAGGHSDFYRTVLHEIGHAIGIANHPLALLTPLLDPLVHANGTAVRDLGNPFGAQLRSFHDPVSPTYGVRATFVGGHLYEGDIYDGTNNDPTTVYEQGSSMPIAFESHPYELMGTGRITPRGQLPARETMRHLISDLDVMILADAYGYGVILPSTLDTAHVTLDSQTGTLLVQGGVTSQAQGQNDTFNISVVGSDIVVQVNDTANNRPTTERVPLSQVRQVVVAYNGGSDSPVTVTLPASIPVEYVHFVVSTNEDSADIGTPGDFIVDIDSAVPGAQIPLRAAIVEATNYGNVIPPRGIYVPRGNYLLDLAGAGGIAQGDLDITEHIVIIGTGAGATIINAGGASGITDRVFDVNGGGLLDLSRVTVTGGSVSVPEGGGGIRVGNDATLELTESAIIGNQATGTNNVGGGILFERLGGGTIERSVIAGNHAGDASTGWGGGIFLGNIPASSYPEVMMTGTIVANNSAGSGPPFGDIHSNSRPLTSVGSNRVETHGGAFVAIATDYVGAVDYVVTGLADTFDAADDATVRSLRDAIQTAQVTAGTQEIWLPGWRFLLMRGGTGALDQGDIDISSEMTIRGVGPGLTIIDADRISDRIFDVGGGGMLDLSHLTLTLGTGRREAAHRHGGAIRVQDGGDLALRNSAVVSNDTLRGDGGGIYFAPTATGTIENSVITANATDENTGGIHLESAVGTGGTVTLARTIVAKNLDDGTSSPDVYAGTNRMLISQGNNRFTTQGSGPGFVPHASDEVGKPTLIVTAIADTFDGTSDPIVMSLRDAIHVANGTPAVNDEIWLPAWDFVLTKVRTTASNSPEMNIEEGDLEVVDSLTIRGIDSSTSVAWRSGAPADEVFELLGDYNFDGAVDNIDYTQWQSSDGDDDGTLNDQDDYDVWYQNFGNTLVVDIS